MAKRMNHAKLCLRDRIRRYGSESVQEDEPAMTVLRRSKPAQRRRQPSKEELRRQAAAALIAWRIRHGAANG